MTKKVKKSGTFFAIVFLTITFGLCLVCADLFSSLITVGSFQITTSTALAGDFSIFAISLYKTQSATIAKETGDTYKLQNGAGYVWKKESTYYVLASGYENLADAENVQKKFEEKDTNCEILTISFPAVNFDLELNSNERSSVKDALSIFKETYQGLYDISVSLDTNVYSEVQANLVLAEIKSKITNVESAFTAIVGQKITSKLLNIKLALNNLFEIIDNLAIGNKASANPYSSEIKFAYFETLELYKELT